jgi:hypothetical protein
LPHTSSSIRAAHSHLNALPHTIGATLNRLDQIEDAKIFIEGGDRVRAAVGEADKLIVAAKATDAAHLAHLPEPINGHRAAEVHVLFSDTLSRRRREGSIVRSHKGCVSFRDYFDVWSADLSGSARTPLD